MSTVLRYPTSTDEEREKAISVASLSIQRGELIVIPTDTVYGIAADAFDSDAVAFLLEAKGRGRDMPPPVLVSSPTTLDALAVRVPAYARALVEKFWPGPLTLVCHQQSSLQWDLGDTRGTVAVRMPDHPIALEILERTGPLAVSSANLTGQPAATDAVAAEEMLGEDVATIVDAGPAPGGEASTIVDATGPTPRVLRLGALSEADLDTVLRPLGLALSGEPPETETGTEPGTETVSLAKDVDETPTTVSEVVLEKSPAAVEPEPEPEPSVAEPVPEPEPAAVEPEPEPEVAPEPATDAPAPVIRTTTVKRRTVTRTGVITPRSSTPSPDSTETPAAPPAG